MVNKRRNTVISIGHLKKDIILKLLHKKYCSNISFRESISKGLQATLLDYADVPKYQKIIARAKALAKEKYGHKLIIENVIICKHCKKYGVIYGYIPQIKRKFIIYAVNDNLLGMHQDVIIEEKRKEIIIGFKVINEGMHVIEYPIEFYDDVCKYCYWKIKQEIIEKAVEVAFDILCHEKMPIIPHEAYLFKQKFVVKLPGQRYVFTSEKDLQDFIYKQLRYIIHEITKNGKFLNEVIKNFKEKVKQGEWRILELYTLMKLNYAKKSIKEINNFEDIMTLVAYIEKTNLNALRRQLKEYGFIMVHNGSIGFAPKEIPKFGKFRDVYPRRKDNIFIIGDLRWKVPRIYLRYLKIYKFWKNEQNILQAKTKYCIIYVLAKHNI